MKTAIKRAKPILEGYPSNGGHSEETHSDSHKLALKPPLKWAGGKRWLVPHVSKIWAKHQERPYVELFCGGLAMALALRPQRALLNDINPHLINFYRQVQTGLVVRLEMHYEEKTFYTYRSTFNRLIKELKHETSDAAEFFYYLNRSCFNGLCRFNQSGEFNVPFGSYKTVSYASDFELLRKAFQTWQFSNHDFDEVKFGEEDFVYADPPYDVEFRTYSAGGFSWNDQVRIAELLSQHHGPVVLSNQATKRIVRLYKQLGYRMTYLSGPRKISCTGDRTAAREVLATRNVG